MRLRWNLGLLRPRRAPLATPATDHPARRRLHFAPACAGLALALWAIMTVRGPSTPGLQPGQPSPVSIQASRSVTYTSAWRTEQERARAESAPDTVVYARDPSIPIEQRAQLAGLLQTISQIRADPTLSRAEKREKLTSLPNSTLVISAELASQIARLSDEQWENVRRQSLQLYDRAVSEHNYALNDQAVAELRTLSLPYWASLDASKEERDLIVLFSGSFLRANLVRDDAATAARKQAARDAVAPVQVTILQGESIVRQGDVVTPDVQEKLEALDELRTETNWLSVGAKGVLALLLALIYGIYLARAQPEIAAATRPTLVVVGLIALTTLAARFTMPLGQSWALAFPLATTALLLAALFNSGLALVSAALLSLLTVHLGDGQLGAALAQLLGCAAGVFVVGRGERSLAFVAAGLVVALVNGLTQLGLYLATVEAPAPVQLVSIAAFGATNGALSAVLALGLYNPVAHLAGIVTPTRLMELAHPAQPLLRKLIREAPGTYYHSVAVGNLAESAAEAIGADALLLRVASYYHDIGKTVRPYFYTDNQSDRQNVHDDLDPHTSAGIIADHVREGVKLARAAGLPPQIVDFIPSHHGTSVIKHFYQRALQQQDTVQVEDYSYPGPRPRTREQAIMMLADSVEATVRSKVQNGKVISSREERPAANGAMTIEELVTSIIDERLRSGQLDESTLTIKDIAAIRKAFITTLQGIYHPRVDYTPQGDKLT
ncbi:MAG TPA: HDIG domain-containing protein [Roseiflexaceae bacterium]|nr:HDIG domain-containing protein [Roseiflexaceae bacterium]